MTRFQGCYLAPESALCATPGPPASYAGQRHNVGRSGALAGVLQVRVDLVMSIGPDGSVEETDLSKLGNVLVTLRPATDRTARPCDEDSLGSSSGLGWLVTLLVFSVSLV